MRGWSVKSSDSPYSYRAEKEGFVVESTDARNFKIVNPDGTELMTCGTAIEAHRVVEASINRTR